MFKKTSAEALYYASMDSTLGEILLCSDGAALTGLYFVDQKDAPRAASQPLPATVRSNPSAGMKFGRRLSGFKLGSREPDLFTAGDRIVHTLGKPRTEGQVAEKIFEQTYEELAQYIAGTRETFQVPLRLKGTPFQQRVWDALRAISYGKTISYGELAAAAGLRAGHGRPVGSAVGHNPVAIIVPCHRILSSAGTLNGYTGGLDRKLALLEIEGHQFY